METPHAGRFAVTPGSRIGDILKRPPLEALEARILLSHALQLTRVQLITQSERELDADEAACVAEFFRRRLSGEPIAYIVGEREFFGLMLTTTPDVLIPRPDTELLVELALERLPRGGRALDMGTGSGAIAVAVSHARPDAKVAALDASPGALEVARKNAQRHHAQVQFLESDWYDQLPEQRFDIIVSNPPYIVAGDPHLSRGDLRFEPVGALTDHGDGLGAIRIIIAGAPARLMPGGWLMLEHGYDQAAAVRALLQEQGFSDVQSWKDIAAIERVSGGLLPAFS